MSFDVDAHQVSCVSSVLQTLVAFYLRKAPKIVLSSLT